MIIGVPKEIKNHEDRVGLTEVGAARLVAEGHTVNVETNAGIGSGIEDAQYWNAGATVLDHAEAVYNADMIIKVKEPIAEEYDFLKENQILFAFLHLANEPNLTKVLCEKKLSAIAYETIETGDGQLPLLTPMSEVAGRMATQIGAHYLQRDYGGKGILLGGVTGIRRGMVTILGGGVVGLNAAKIAVGLGADVTILDINRARLEYLDHVFQGRIQTLYSNPRNIAMTVERSDLLIGAVLVTGAKAPVLVTRKMVESMASGGVIVDVAVDQGGCIETCAPTTHEVPTFLVDGVIHYCVPNMPGIVARTSTYALTNATLDFASMIAARGIDRATLDRHLARGLNVHAGQICYAPVAYAMKDL